VQEDIEIALNQIASTTETSGNMKKELKQTIYQTVGNLRKLFVTLIDIQNSKNRTIAELEKVVASNKVEIEATKRSTLTEPPTPSGDTRRDPPMTSTREVPPSVTSQEGRHYNKTEIKVPKHTTQIEPSTPSGDNRRDPPRTSTQGLAPSGTSQEELQARAPQTRLYSDALRGKNKKARYVLTVTSTDNEPTERIKDILKSNIKPIDIRVGISSFKSLKNGRIQIETGSKEEIEILTKYINEKCKGTLQAKILTLRRPKLVIYNVPEDISVENIEATMQVQNPELNLKTGDINAKFLYRTRRNTQNLVMEVGPQTRTLLLHTKIKLGWLICNVGDYLVTNQCYNCSKYNHRHRECRGTITCPLCTGNHSLKDCSVNSQNYKCINCLNFNKQNKNANINDNHSALDRNCPSLKAVLEKYKQNTDYGDEY
jgi:hypothetical protein